MEQLKAKVNEFSDVIGEETLKLNERMSYIKEWSFKIPFREVVEGQLYYYPMEIKSKKDAKKQFQEVRTTIQAIIATWTPIRPENELEQIEFPIMFSNLMRIREVCDEAIEVFS